MKRMFRLGDEEKRTSYELLSGLVVPRPIGWIATHNPDGANNLAPYSFFNMVSAEPPVVLFSGGRRQEVPKDSVANAVASGAFSVNIVTDATAEAMNLTSASLPPDVDEFEHAGLTAVPCELVDAPMVGEAAANLECKVFETLDLGGNIVVFGEVVGVHVDEAVLETFGHRVDPTLLKAVGRMAGRNYVRTHEVFSLTRPG